MLVKVLLTVILLISPNLAQTILKPCQTEDSVMCYWNAQTSGNGHGQSFWTDGSGTPHYLK